MTIPIGIDLGTTYSCIAYLNPDGRPMIIPGPDGTNTTASAVAWLNGELFIGDAAKNLQKMGGHQVGAYFKRAMGDPYYQIELGGETYSATELSSLILKALKDQASAHLGEEVTSAVITVPAYFDDPRRIATMEAARLAGIEPLLIINEPTAAALAYGVRPNREGGYALVYDLGGGTFDVTLARITDSDLIVVATAGDHELGGKDWDDRLISELGMQFEAEFGEHPEGEDMESLLVGAENLKRSLSQVSSGSIQVTAKGKTGTYQVSREAFQDISGDLLERTRSLTEQVLAEADVQWNEITHVIPVGGSTRMPMVQEFLEQISGQPPAVGIHPDEAVAIGAAIRAALILKDRDPEQSKRIRYIPGPSNISDVMSHSLGMIAASDDNSRYLNSHLIRKNQSIPARETRPYRLALSARRENKLEVYLTQGEDDNPLNCSYLGVYAFTDIPNTGATEALIDVTFGYDANGIVQISAEHSDTSTNLTLTQYPVPPDVPERFLGSPQDAKSVGEATIYLVVDVSGSMSGQPLQEAQRAAKKFMENTELGPVSIGIMCVSDDTKVLEHPSSKRRTIQKGIDALRVGLTGGGNSAHPFDKLLKELKGRKGSKYAVVLADGMWGNQAGAVTQAIKCHENDINIVGVGFGHADEQFLRDISNMDIGGFTDLSKLTETFTTIAQEIGTGGTSGGGSWLQRGSNR